MLDLSLSGPRCGVYGIYIDDKLVYIGQSKDVWFRANAHRHCILCDQGSWYPLAREFHDRGHNITLKMLKVVESKDLRSKEKEYITQLQPLFNYQLKGQEKLSKIGYEAATELLNIISRPKPIPQEERVKQIQNWFGE